MISKKTVQHLADLSKLELSQKELMKFQKQLGEILNYFCLLKKVTTSQVLPTSQVTGLENVLAKDEISPSLSSKEALSQTKNQHNNYFKVKAILNGT